MRSLLPPLMAGLITACVVVSSAIAQPAATECSQSVKIIVSYPPGSPDDVIARILAQKLSEAGGRFHVENLPGAAGMIGTATAARAAPDGCTMVIVNQNFVVQPAIGEKLSYEVPESFTPVALLLAAPETISVNPSVPATTLKELAALVKANPGKYNYASPGNGSSPHLASERLFKQTLGLDVVHVPFQGGPPAVTSTVAGHTQILHLTLPIVAPLVRDGKLRLLAVAGTTRAAEFPDVPTLARRAYRTTRSGFGMASCFPGERLTTSLNSGIGKSARSWRCLKCATGWRRWDTRWSMARGHSSRRICRAS